MVLFNFLFSQSASDEQTNLKQYEYSCTTQEKTPLEKFIDKPHIVKAIKEQLCTHTRVFKVPVYVLLVCLCVSYL